jgi:folate-binding protein YgfZ
VNVPESYAVRVERDVLRVHGPDAASYLQGQLSQDIDALDPSSSAFSLLLEPDGKLGFWLRVTRERDDAFLLDLDRGWGEPLRARLERFKLRVQADVELLDWSCVRVALGAEPIGLNTRFATFDWPALPAVDLLGPDIGVPPPVDEISAADYESLRIAAGVPRMGAEIDEGRIAAEAGIVDVSVSFTKGCYTGQELVARIDSRGGNVPRHLRGLALDGEPPAPGDEVVVGGEVVGQVTSAAPAFGEAGRAVALAYVKRSVEPPVDATVGGCPSHLDRLPLPG